MRVGILGGAFNPPHIGHLLCAQEALLQLSLDKVVFVPTGEPPHRTLDDDPGAEVRLEMVELAVADDARFAVSRIELDRSGPSYTVDTLAELRAAQPEAELFLILGADQAAALPGWHEPERVLEQATVAVVERVSTSRNVVGIKLARLPGAERVRYLEMPLIQVSSTVVRRRVGRGESIRYLVPDPVVSLIASRGLYAGKSAVSPDAASPPEARAKAARAGAKAARAGAKAARGGAKSARGGAKSARAGAKSARAGAKSARAGAKSARAGAKSAGART